MNHLLKYTHQSDYVAAYAKKLTMIKKLQDELWLLGFELFINFAFYFLEKAPPFINMNVDKCGFC